jgi:glycosyltransferase involved in cell wall biosynthesis
VGGHRELIDDGRTGFLFRPDDPAALAECVIRVLRNPGQWPAMRSAGRSFVEAERTWQRSVSRYRPLYSELLRRPV